MEGVGKRKINTTMLSSLAMVFVIMKSIFKILKLVNRETKDVGIEILMKKKRILVTKPVLLPVKRVETRWTLPLLCLSQKEFCIAHLIMYVSMSVFRAAGPLSKSDSLLLIYYATGFTYGGHLVMWNSGSYQLYPPYNVMFSVSISKARII